jgi:hypothetical protein
MHTYASQWFNVCYNALENLEKMLTLDDVVEKNKAT